MSMPVALSGWSAARGPWPVLALHAPFVAAGPVMAIPRHDLGLLPVAALAVVAFTIGALHLRLSLATDDRRARLGVPVFLAVAALVYVPLWWLTWDWAVMQWFVVASAATALRGVPRIAAAAGPIVGQTTVAAWYAADDPTVGWRLLVVFVTYNFALLVMGGAALYGSTRLVGVLADLSTARHELAEAAVGRERLRVSRDLHDLLGQSLSAVALKGDLALRLLPTDSSAARAEIESLTGLARGALRDIRAVTRAEHRVSLASELDAAVSLLALAGIAATTDVADGPPLDPGVDEALGWAVREAATNALRHSTATVWSATLRRRGGQVLLDVVNDGAPDPMSGATGTGIAGLARRANVLGGDVVARRTPDGRFHLSIAVPEAAP